MNPFFTPLTVGDLQLPNRLVMAPLTRLADRLTLFNDTSHYDKAGLAIPAIPTARLSKWWDGPAVSRADATPPPGA